MQEHQLQVVEKKRISNDGINYRILHLYFISIASWIEIKPNE